MSNKRRDANGLASWALMIPLVVVGSVLAVVVGVWHMLRWAFMSAVGGRKGVKRV